MLILLMLEYVQINSPFTGKRIVMFGKKNEKLDLLKDVIGSRAAYTEFVKNVELTKDEKDVLMRASIEVNKKTPNHGILDQAYAILVQKSFTRDTFDAEDSSSEEAPVKSFNIKSFEWKKVIKPIVIAVTLTLAYQIYVTYAKQSSEEVLANNLYEKNGKTYYKEDGELFSGTAVTFHNGSIAVLFKQRFVNGLLDGKQEMLYENGQKNIEQYYENGAAHGTYTSWLENGQLFWEKNYDNGQIIGEETKWYKNGNLKYKRLHEYGKDEPIFDSFFHKNGQIFYEYDRVNNTSKGPYYPGGGEMPLHIFEKLVKVYQNKE